jgi:hypothetical protein
LAQDQPAPPIRVSVLGQPFEWKDIWAFMGGLYKPHPDSPQIKIVRQAPAAMPSDAPYVSYQGRDPGPPPTEVIWMAESAPASATDPNDAKAMNDQYAAAAALAAMDAGNAGPALQAIYAKTPSDRESRLALGNSFAEALRSASGQAAAFSANEADWIRTHIAPGTTRAAAYEMLKSRRLTAYNRAFVKGKPATGGSCDLTDRLSGAWPYKGEPLPKQEGACASWFFPNPPTSASNPEAQLELSGAFNLYCGWSTYIEIRFNDDDRVKEVQIDEPRPTCL